MGKNFRSPDDIALEPASGVQRRIGVVCARWNEPITRRLLSGVEETLEARGTAADDIDLVWVPGAFEIPLACQTMAARGDYDAVIALGCVIRGDTAHFDYVAGPAADGILRAQLSTGVPIVFGVLTVDNVRQALVRSVIDGDLEGDNKGAEAADTALEMIAVLEHLRTD